jgi:AhpD family alkylhydroperoxidase
MTNVKVGLVASVIAGLVAGELAMAQRGPARPPVTPPPQNTTSTMPATGTMMTPEQTLKDIEQTAGFVPGFFRNVSDAELPSFWLAMKTFQMNPNTALDNKTKELIGLAVASQIPCQYCIYFHTEAARANGASEQQIREAVGMSAVVRMASTVINGTQVDNVQFRKDVQRMFKEGGKKPPQAAQR